MKRIHFTLGSLLAILALLIIWSSQKQAKQGASASPQSVQSGTYPTKVEEEKNSAASSTSAPLPIPQSEETKKANRMKLIAGIISSLNTSITFYGKVIDQNDNPVPYASIEYGVIDKFDADGSRYHGTADASGNFSISGIKGAVLTVGVWKGGYYIIDDKSKAAFAYGVGPDSTRKVPPTKDDPAIFILQKMGQTEPLMRVEQYFIIPRDGTPVEISLQTGRKVAAGQGDLRIEAWTFDQNAERGKPYDWRCVISVSNGGLILRQDQFDFEAPTEGYKASDEITMPQSAERWRSQASREYFLKFTDNRYARIKFSMYAGGNHYFQIESYLNPSAGSRNLEFDPAKRINAK